MARATVSLTARSLGQTTAINNNFAELYAGAATQVAYKFIDPNDSGLAMGDSFNAMFAELYGLYPAAGTYQRVKWHDRSVFTNRRLNDTFNALYAAKAAATPLTLSPTSASVATGTTPGTQVFTIANVPTGVTPMIMPDDGRLVISGSEGAGWKVSVGLTSIGADTATIIVNAIGAPPAIATVTFGGTSYGLPANLGWNNTVAPLAITKGGGVYQHGLNLKALVAPTAWAAPLARVFHVDSVSGVDTNSGIGTTETDYSLSVKTLTKAVQLGNATSLPYRIAVKSGSRFSRAAAYGGGSNIYPTQPCVYYCPEGGSYTITAGNSYTYTQDATYSNVYTFTQATLGTILLESAPLTAYPNAIVANPVMFKTQLAKVADKPTCAVTANSWYQNVSEAGLNIGTVPVTGSNPVINNVTPILGDTYAYAPTSTFDLYFENATFEGGTNCATAATRGIIWFNCKSYVSRLASAGRGFTADNTTGFVGAFNCESHLNGTDGLNWHNATGQGYFVTYYCKAWCNGSTFTAGNNSCNGLTGHETTRAVDIGGDYRYNQGGTVAFIDTAKFYTLGATVKFDLGDPPTQAGYKAGYYVGGSAVGYIEEGSIEMSASNDPALLTTTATSSLYTRNLNIITGAISAFAGSTIGTF